MALKVRDKRNKGWFYLDNDYLNGYSKIFGAVGTAIYVSLCRHADDNQKCFPSNKLMAEELNISDRTVRTHIKVLAEWNVISVEKSFDSDTKRYRNNVYTLLDKSVWNKPEETNSHGKPEEVNDKSQRKQFPHKDTNVKNTHVLATPSVAGSESQKIFELFYEGNNPTINFGNKTSRKAADFLIDKFGLDQTLKMTDYAIRVGGSKFAPSITTPYELKEKLASLKLYAEREKKKHITIV